MTLKEIRHHPIQDNNASYFQRLQVSSKSLLNGDASQVSRAQIETRIQLLRSIINYKNELVGYPDDFEAIFSQLKDALKRLLLTLPNDIEGIEISEGVTYNQITTTISDRKGNNVRLTKSEATIFSALLEQPYKVFSRDDLLDVLGNYGRTYHSSIDSHISHLRIKLRQVGINIKIQTYRRIGYFWNSGELTPDDGIDQDKIRLSERVFLLPNSGVISAGDTSHRLTKSELLILQSLSNHTKRVYTRHDLVNKIEVDGVCDMNIIVHHIKRIRKKLNQIHPGLGNHIKTARGDGYYWE